MNADTSTFTPRLRMSRHSPLQYDRSSNIASTSEAGPSRLPQILDLDLKDMPLSDDQFSSSELNTPKVPTNPATTRSDNPAAVLRALLSRLPATQSHALSVQDGTERESDFDTVSESNISPSIAQESLKHVFSKARRDPGDTPQKARRRRNSIDASEVEASPRVERERATNKGKRRSMSDDEVENASQSIKRRDIRLKSTSQPITMEFLRERFSDSHNLGTSIEPPRSPTSNHDSSNDTATILRNLNSSQATPPAATSTPHQSLRLSTNSRFQFHSNLLDQDSEMQKAIEGLDSYDEGVTHDQASASRALSSSKTLQTTPVLRPRSSKSSIKPKHTPSNHQTLAHDQSHSMDDLRTSSQHREQFHADPSRSPSPLPQLHLHHDGINVISDSSRANSSKDRSIPHSERHLRSEVHSSSSRLSPLPRSETFRHHSPPSRTDSSAGSLRNHDDDYVDIAYERQRNWNSPRPIWHKPPPSPNLTKGRGASPSFSHPPSAHSPPPTTNVHTRRNSFRTSEHLNEQHHDHHSYTSAPHILNHTPAKEKGRSSRLLLLSSNEQSSPTPSHTSSLQAIDNIYRTNDPSIRRSSHSPSPPLFFSKERNGLPTIRVKSLRQRGINPSFVDQEENFSGNVNMATLIQDSNNRVGGLSRRRTTEPTTPLDDDAVYDRDMESDGLKETDFSSQGEMPKLGVVASSPDISEDGHGRSGTPLRSGDLPQENGISSTPDNIAQIDTTTLPLTPTRNKTSQSLRIQSISKTPKPPGGWVSTPALAQSMPVDSPVDIPERSRGLLTPVASLSKGSKLELKTPAAPGAWPATPAAKKSILKVRFESEVSTLSDKSVESSKHLHPSFDSSTSGLNALDVGDDLQQTEPLSPKSPPSPRRRRSPKSPKIRVLDAFGREQEPDESKRADSSPSSLRLIDAIGEESHVEGTEVIATPSYSTSSRGELLSRIRNGLDDLAVGIDDFDKDNQALSIDYDRVHQLTTISRRARGLREKLYSQANDSHSFLSSTFDTKPSWFPRNPKVCIFLVILQLLLIWLMYRISINWAQELFLNTYYDPFNPELHLYTFKSDVSLYNLRSEGTRTSSWLSLVGYIWEKWTHFMQFCFWQAWNKGVVPQYDNTWTPT